MLLHLAPSRSLSLKAFEVLASSLIVNFHLTLTSMRCARANTRAWRHVRKCISKLGDATQIAISIASARLDYCNSVLYKTSQSNISKLQRAQTCSLARVVTNTRKRDHITPILVDHTLVADCCSNRLQDCIADIQVSGFKAT